MDAKYDPKKSDYNVDLTTEESLKEYLGTYFPRSYAESFCIFDDIFQNANYRNALFEDKSLNILSVGCGTGGDVIGLLAIINKYCHNVSEIKIWAIDENGKALEILERIKERFESQTSKRIGLRVIKNTFSSILDADVRQIKEVTFDFILSFKAICEIISAVTGSNDNSYFDFVMKFTSLLSSKGLCLLLDVTTKAEHNSSFYPELMNRQVNQALLKLEGFRTLLPLPCAFYERSCVIRCFTQQKFQVSHKRKKYDTSKVCYRIIGRSEFINRLVNSGENVKYVIRRKKQSTVCCFYSTGKKILDGYKLIG